MSNAEIETKSSGVANAATLAALGVLAYVTETLLHEAGGHGTACILTGGKITLLAPLYMRCSVQTMILNIAGPAANILAGFASLAALRVFMNREGTIHYFVWLTLVFNWLVAAGYLTVGAATGFGDWSAIFASITPAWHWRLPALAIGMLCYFGALSTAVRELRRIIGRHPSNSTLRRLVLTPAASAAIVAISAEIYGQGARPLGILLALGCTLVVGLSLVAFASDDAKFTNEKSRLHLGFNPIAIGAAIVAATGFVFVIGPGWA